MIPTLQTAPVGQLARALAPDDYTAGIYIAVLRVRAEFMPCGMFGEMNADAEPVRVSLMPWDEDLPAAMQVIEYCLPFVFVRKPCGGTMTLDTRRYALVRMSEEFGNAVFAEAKRLRREAERKEKRARKQEKS